MIKWIRTSRLSIKKSLSDPAGGNAPRDGARDETHGKGDPPSPGDAVFLSSLALSDTKVYEP